MPRTLKNYVAVEVVKLPLGWVGDEEKVFAM
jgi:hypothetical protein